MTHAFVNFKGEFGSFEARAEILGRQSRFGGDVLLVRCGRFLGLASVVKNQVTRAAYNCIAAEVGKDGCAATIAKKLGFRQVTA